jgi:hypothetical protein
MKKKLKNIIGVLIFLTIFVMVFYVVDTTLKFKYADGILTIEDFYHYPDNSIDVLLLGSSHVGVNIDTIQLNEEFGIASYNLWGSVQPTWNSYYYLKEALKTQKPKVVVLEGFLTSQDYEYMDYSRIIKNTLGMKWSLNKLKAIDVSATPDVKIFFLASVPITADTMNWKARISHAISGILRWRRKEYPTVPISRPARSLP